MSKSTSSPQTSETIRVFFDARFTRTTHHDGISRYGSCLLEALLGAVEGTRIEVTAIISDEAQLGLLPDCRWIKLNSPTSPREVFIARKLNALGADVVFSTMQVMGSTGRSYGLILTVHDLIYYSHPLPRPISRRLFGCCGGPITSASPPSACCWAVPMRSRQ